MEEMYLLISSESAMQFPKPSFSSKNLAALLAFSQSSLFRSSICLRASFNSSSVNCFMIKSSFVFDKTHSKLQCNILSLDIRPLKKGHIRF